MSETCSRYIAISLVVFAEERVGTVCHK